MKKLLVIAVIVFFGTPAHALTIDALTLNADGWDLTTNYWTGDDNSNLSAAQIGDLVDVSGLSYLYKSNVGTGEDGLSYDPYYETYFDNSPTDPEDAAIEFIGSPGQHIESTSLFLYVKDGSSTPAYYIFDIGGWDGIEDIVLENFWAGNGAISHVAVVGAAHAPEPATLLLFGAGLVGLTGARLRKKK